MNKRKRALIAGFLILAVILAVVVIKIINRDPIAPFQSRAGSMHQLDRDSRVTYTINSHHIDFFTDSNGETLVFYSNPQNVILGYLYFPIWPPEDTRVHWHLSARQDSVIFTSVLLDGAIDRITVKAEDGREMSKELHPIQYNNYRFVIAVDNRIQQSPVDITGYSKENKVVYKNVNQKYDKSLFK
ncbi:hypothetical protein J27TS7_32600 [Paenibacillus dendritiformis]|uniref:hypothetical protein n=1 Tax=Paenibacillus dendritiformis TaxID=130049 RepID=UPI001B2DDB34|nr:hypothetical protein [Paenibacillus dendritiformis]GIO73746.1 hypothetical protein J27TS7_32600 [Paenibacillus dendritiformis]